MKMCEEMQKLRDRLDKIGIVWEDASSSTPEPIIEKWYVMVLKDVIAM